MSVIPYPYLKAATGQAGTHIAILVAVGMIVVVSFRLAACLALAIAASIECGLIDYNVMRLGRT